VISSDHEKILLSWGEKVDMRAWCAFGMYQKRRLTTMIRLRHCALVLLAASGLAWAGSLKAADAGDFDILGIRLGMTADEVVMQARARGFDDVKRSPAPSFDQAVALENREQVLPRDYSGVQSMKFGNDREAAEVFLVQTPSGSQAARITYHFLGSDLNLDRMTALVVEKYGEPERKTDRYWLWGDTAEYATRRTAPYLEFDRNPLITFTTVQPLASLTLGHNAMRDRSRQAIAEAAAERGGGEKPRF
jgi:hypothetical protein